MPRRLLSTVLAALALAPLASAGTRSAGKYSGVVVFDRWDACALYSGIYVMYVSEKAKEPLREYAGKAIQVDASEVSQPHNPGDGLIKKAKFLAAAPEARNWVLLDGVALRCVAASKAGEKPAIDFIVTNAGAKEVKVFAGELAPTLIMKHGLKAAGESEPFDGPSFALVTRQSFIIGGDDTPRTKGKGVASGRDYSWSIDAALPAKFILRPAEEQRVRITFDLPPGEFDFLAGYGGGVHEGRCLASNRVAFDIGEKGAVKWVKVKGR